MTEHTMFLHELRELLIKYHASISADDHWEGYPECGQDIRLSVEFVGSFDEVEFKSIDAESLDKVIGQRVIDNK